MPDSVTVPLTATVAFDGAMRTENGLCAVPLTVTGTLNVWLPDVTVTVPEPTLVQVMVAVEPVPVTVNAFAGDTLAVANVKVAPVWPPARFAPIACVVPGAHVTDAGAAVRVPWFATTTSSPHAARPRPAAPMASERQLTSLIR